LLRNSNRASQTNETYSRHQDFCFHCAPHASPSKNAVSSSE
jgi:hypothetical protein